MQVVTFFRCWALLCFALLTISCAQMQGGRTAERARVDSYLSQVHVGDSRSQVQNVLGQPYSSKKEGRDLVLTYITGPERGASQSSQQSALNMGVLSSILGAAGSFGGKSLGTVGSVGSQAASLGNSFNSPTSSTDTSEQTTINVVLRSNKVVSVDRTDSGRIGIGAGR